MLLDLYFNVSLLFFAKRMSLKNVTCMVTHYLSCHSNKTLVWVTNCGSGQDIITVLFVKENADNFGEPLK